MFLESWDFGLQHGDFLLGLGVWLGGASREWLLCSDSGAYVSKKKSPGERSPNLAIVLRFH